MPKQTPVSTWTKIQDQKRKNPNCTCPLKPGMDWHDLRPLGAGCTVTYVCPVLRNYREYVGGPPSPDQYEARARAAAEESEASA